MNYLVKDLIAVRVDIRAFLILFVSILFLVGCIDRQVDRVENGISYTELVEKYKHDPHSFDVLNVGVIFKEGSHLKAQIFSYGPTIYEDIVRHEEVIRNKGYATLTSRFKQNGNEYIILFLMNGGPYIPIVYVPSGNDSAISIACTEGIEFLDVEDFSKSFALDTVKFDISKKVK